MDLSIYILLIYEIFYIYDQYYFINTALQVTDEITTDVFEHHAKALMVEHVEENPDSPLFLYLSLQNNHGPLTHIQDSHFSDIELELINNIPNEVRRAYTRLNIKLDHFLRNTIQNLKVNFFLYFIFGFSLYRGACSYSIARLFPAIDSSPSSLLRNHEIFRPPVAHERIGVSIESVEIFVRSAVVFVTALAAGLNSILPFTVVPVVRSLDKAGLCLFAGHDHLKIL